MRFSNKGVTIIPPTVLAVVIGLILATLVIIQILAQFVTTEQVSAEYTEISKAKESAHRFIQCFSIDDRYGILDCKKFSNGNDNCFIHESDALKITVKTFNGNQCPFEYGHKSGIVKLEGFKIIVPVSVEPDKVVPGLVSVEVFTPIRGFVPPQRR